MITTIIERFNKNAGIICFLILLLFIIFLPHPIIWDEDFFITGIDSLKQYGLSKNYILNTPGAPMYSIVHYLFSPITHLQSPQIRFLNLAMCLGIVVLIYKTLKMNKSLVNIPTYYPFYLFLLPGFFVLGFFAISEAPCLLFYTISLFFFMKYITSDKHNLFFILLSGFFLGFAILTRQLFLVCVAPACVLIFYRQFKNRLPALALFIIAVLILIGPVFYLWKGLVPSSSIFKYNAKVSSFSIKHTFLSFGYAFLYCIIIMPAYIYQFLKKNLKVIMGLTLIGFIAASLLKDDSFAPMIGLLSRVFSPAIVKIISFSFFKIIVIASFIILYFFLFELYQYRHDFKQVFFILSILSILVTPGIILETFSSRYSMQIAPMLIIFAYFRIKPLNFKVQFIVNCVAIAINIISVITFFPPL